MNNYTSLFEDLAKNGNRTDDFWENTDCVYRFLKDHNPEYAQADAISVRHSSDLFDGLTAEQTEIIEEHYYYITDYMSLRSRFFYSFGLVLALLEFIQPPLSEGHIKLLDNTARAFSQTPAAVAARQKAQDSYQTLSALFAPLGRQSQLDQAFALMRKPQRIRNSLLPFVGYATQRLRWSQGGPWNHTLLSRALLSIYENPITKIEENKTEPPATK